jgi:CBS domain containing-hemolysin-like protein
MAALARSEGVFGPRTAHMIVGATRLAQLRVHQVMVPRQNVTFLSAQRDLAENIEIVKASQHSRLPISKTEDLDQVAGIVLAKELLVHVQEHPGEPIDWDVLIREPLTIPEGTPLNSLLRTFQDSRSHLAIVVDEYGGVEGVVTLEDVLEEIVGEIVDESDAYIEEMWPQQDGSLEVLGSAEMRKIGARLGFEWPPSAEISTPAGLVAELAGRIPLQGEVVEWQGYRFEVLQATQRRAERIRITRTGDATR